MAIRIILEENLKTAGVMTQALDAGNIDWLGTASDSRRNLALFCGHDLWPSRTKRLSAYCRHDCRRDDLLTHSCDSNDVGADRINLVPSFALSGDR
jgi:hypothetical protein